MAREKGLEPAVIPICLPNGLWRPGHWPVWLQWLLVCWWLVQLDGAFFFCP